MTVTNSVLSETRLSGTQFSSKPTESTKNNTSNIALSDVYVSVRPMQPVNPQTIPTIQIQETSLASSAKPESSVSAASETEPTPYFWDELNYPQAGQVDLDKVPSAELLETYAPRTGEVLSSLKEVPVDVYWEKNNGQGLPGPYQLKFLRDKEKGLIYMTINNWTADPWVARPDQAAIFASPILAPFPGHQINTNWFTDEWTYGNPFYCKKRSLEDKVPETPWKLIGFANRTQSYDSLSTDREFLIVSDSQDYPSWFFFAVPYSGPVVGFPADYVFDEGGNYLFTPSTETPYLHLTGTMDTPIPLEIYDIPGTTHTTTVRLNGMFIKTRAAGEPTLNLSANELGPLHNWARVIVNSENGIGHTKYGTFDFMLNVEPSGNGYCLSPENTLSAVAGDEGAAITNTYRAYIGDGPAKATMVVATSAGEIVHAVTGEADTGEYLEGTWDKRWPDGSPYTNQSYYVHWQFQKSDKAPSADKVSAADASTQDLDDPVPWQSQRFRMSLGRFRNLLPAVVAGVEDDWYVGFPEKNLNHAKHIAYDLGYNLPRIYGTGGASIGEIGGGRAAWDRRAIKPKPFMRPTEEYFYAIRPLTATNMFARFSAEVISDKDAELIFIGHGNDAGNGTGGYFGVPSGLYPEETIDPNKIFPFKYFPPYIKSLLPGLSPFIFGPVFNNPDDGLGIPGSYHQWPYLDFDAVGTALGNNIALRPDPLTGELNGYNDSYSRVEGHSCFSMVEDPFLHRTYLAGSTSLMKNFGIYPWNIQMFCRVPKTVAFGYNDFVSIISTGDIASGIHQYHTWGDLTDFSDPYYQNWHATFDPTRPYSESVARVLDLPIISFINAMHASIGGYPFFSNDHTHNGYFTHTEMVAHGWAPEANFY